MICCGQLIEKMGQYRTERCGANGVFCDECQRKMFVASKKPRPAGELTRMLDALDAAQAALAADGQSYSADAVARARRDASRCNTAEDARNLFSIQQLLRELGRWIRARVPGSEVLFGEANEDGRGLESAALMNALSQDRAEAAKGTERLVATLAEHQAEMSAVLAKHSERSDKRFKQLLELNLHTLAVLGEVTKAMAAIAASSQETSMSEKTEGPWDRAKHTAKSELAQAAALTAGHQAAYRVAQGLVAAAKKRRVPSAICRWGEKMIDFEPALGVFAIGLGAAAEFVPVVAANATYRRVASGCRVWGGFAIGKALATPAFDFFLGTFKDVGATLPAEEDAPKPLHSKGRVLADEERPDRQEYASPPQGSYVPPGVRA